MSLSRRRLDTNRWDGEYFYVLDFDKKRFIVKGLEFRKQTYNLFNGEIFKVFYEQPEGQEESSDDDAWDNGEINMVRVQKKLARIYSTLTNIPEY